MKAVLQTRWKVEAQYLVYYGLPNKPFTFKRKIKINSNTRRVLLTLDGKKTLCPQDITPKIKWLIKHKILVDIGDLITLPQNLDEAVFCTHCAANSYTIPGLQFDNHGLCPICQHTNRLKNYTNVLPVLKHLKPNKKYSYDIAVFYTGGKDSSFLLYYLSKVLHLKVLALTWLIPFMSDQALQNIEHAKERLPHVTFVAQKVPDEQLKKIYKKCYSLQGNTCICPSLAYVLFYPLLIKHKVPYLVLGNEPAQCKNLVYNGMIPYLYTYPLIQHISWIFLNLGRILTLKKPYRKGQFEMYMTVKSLAFGKSSFMKHFNYRNELVEHTFEAIHEAPDLIQPFKEAVMKSKNSPSIPALIHIDLHTISNTGLYQWNATKNLLKDKMNWVDCDDETKSLHTSCKIERCKEYSQLQNFRAMNSFVIPFSALELAIATGEGSLTKKDALQELYHHSGFTEHPPKEFEYIFDYLKDYT